MKCLHRKVVQFDYNLSQLWCKSFSEHLGLRLWYSRIQTSLAITCFPIKDPQKENPGDSTATCQVSMLGQDLCNQLGLSLGSLHHWGYGAWKQGSKQGRIYTGAKKEKGPMSGS